MSVFTDWEVFPLSKPAKSLMANGKVTIAGTVRVSFTIVNGPKGLFAGLPQQVVEKDGETKYYPHVKILDTETYNMFQKEAVEAYNTRLEAPPAKKKQSNIPF